SSPETPLLPLVHVQAVVEGLQTDPENLGGLLLVAVVVIERRQDQVAFRFAERRAYLERGLAATRARGAADGRRTEVGGQVRGLDLAFGHGVGALHRVLQLAHVAGAVVGPQPRASGRWGWARGGRA